MGSHLFRLPRIHHVSDVCIVHGASSSIKYTAISLLGGVTVLPLEMQSAPRRAFAPSLQIAQV